MKIRARTAGAFAALLLVGACTADDGAEPPGTTVVSAVERFATEGLTFEYSTDVFVGVDSASDDLGAILVTIELRPSSSVSSTPPPDTSGTASVRVTTVKDSSNTSLELSPSVVDIVESIATDRNESESIRFVNGSGWIDREDSDWRFVGLTDDGTQLVQVDAPNATGEFDDDVLAAALERLTASMFVDVSAEVLSGRRCEVALEVVSEVELAEGAAVAPGEVVTATWRVRNTGQCSWSESDSWVFTGGDPLTLVDASPVGPVEPGEETAVTVVVLAPDEVGAYSAQWQFLSANSREVAGPPVAVTIEVSDP